MQSAVSPSSIHDLWGVHRVFCLSCVLTVCSISFLNQGASAARVQGDSRFSRDQQRTKRKEKTYFHKTKPNRGEGAAA